VCRYNHLLPLFLRKMRPRDLRIARPIDF
jgi:hypothetical protein